MLCERCIGKLALNLSKEAKKILNVLASNEPKSQSEIILSSRLSYAVTYRTLKELLGTSFIEYKEKGRSKVYGLTESGEMLVSLCQKGGRKKC